MKGITTLTADAVAKLKAGISDKTPADVASRILALPEAGYQLEWEKKEFSFDFPDFVKWLTGADVTVQNGDVSVIQKLAIEHAKFTFAGALRSLLEKCSYTPDGELTSDSAKDVKRFIKDWVYVPGRSSSLTEKDDEKLESDYEKLLAKARAIEAELARRTQGAGVAQ